MPPVRDENVGRFDVSMHNAFGVRGIERIGNFNGDGKQPVKVQRTAGDHVLQGHTFHELHDHECAPLFFADVVNGTDIRMVQGRSGFGFAPKTFQRLRVARQIVRQKLKRDEASQAGIFGLVDHTHTAATELSDDPIVRDDLADHWRESYVCKTGKSMKAMELAVSPRSCCCKIALSVRRHKPA